MRRAFASLLTLGAAALMCCCAARTDEPVHAAARVAKQQPANLTRNTLLLRGTAPLVLGVFEIDGDGANGDRGTIQPGAAVWNADSGQMLNDRQINVPPNGNFTTAVSNAGHDGPALVSLANGAVLVPYGAASTYVAYHPPGAWHCFTTLACEPFKYVAHERASPSILDELAQSPEYLMPAVGISELSFATLGNTTIVAGQQQPSARFGEAGTQAYVTLHASGDSASFDTTAGSWNFTSSHEPPGDGLEALTLTPSDDAYFTFGITSSSPGSGSVSMDFGSGGCTIPVSSTGNPADNAAQIAAAFPHVCPQLGSRFGAMQVQYDPSMRVGGAVLAPAVVGITASNPQGLPAWSAVRLTCSGAIACGSPHGPNTVLDERGSGLHRHFLFGGVLQRGPYIFYLMDVEQLTGSWYGRGQSSLGLALACFRATEPHGAQWTWTDCSGRHPFAVAPGTRLVARLSPGQNNPYLIPAPQRGYSGDMAPYAYDWSMRGQRDTRGIPVIAAVSSTVMQDGTFMFAHGCETTTRVLTVCYAKYDPRSGRTESAGTVDLPNGGGSLASIALRTLNDGEPELAVMSGVGRKWSCGQPGICFMTYRYDRSGRWIHLGTASVGGLDNAGFPGTVSVSGDKFVVQMHRLTERGVDSEVQIRS